MQKVRTFPGRVLHTVYFQRQRIQPTTRSHTRKSTLTTMDFGMEFLRSWWRYQMETFSALLAICEFPAQRPVTRSFDVFFDLRLNKRLSKQWWGWWFVTLSRPLLRHRNESRPLINFTQQHKMHDMFWPIFDQCDNVSWCDALIIPPRGIHHITVTS